MNRGIKTLLYPKNLRNLGNKISKDIAINKITLKNGNPLLASKYKKNGTKK